MSKIVRETEISNTVRSMFDNAGIEMKEDKMSWEQVDDIWTTMANGIVSIAQETNGVIQVLNESKMYESDIELKAIVTTFIKDIAVFTDSLSDIKSRRGNYTGEISDPDELVLMLGIFEEIRALHTTFATIISPHLLEITSRLSSLEEKIRSNNLIITEDSEGLIIEQNPSLNN